MIYIKDITSSEQEAWDKIIADVAEIRGFEEAIEEVYEKDLIESPVHLSIGQELTSVLIGIYKQKKDVVIGNYRSHALAMAVSKNRKGLVDELCASNKGIYGGRAGSMHLGDPKENMPWTSAIVGSGVPIAAGAAQACKWDKEGAITVCMFGDGAIEEGGVLETLNIASSRGLPLLMVLEDNDLAIYTRKDKRTSKYFDYSKLAGAFGIRYEESSLKQPIETQMKIKELYGYCRDKCKPAIIRVKCYRWRQHVGIKGDYDRGYREIDELKEWIECDIVENSKKFFNTNTDSLRIKENFKEIYIKAFMEAKR